MSRAKSAPAKPTIESVLDAAIETLQLGLEHIRAEINKIAAGKAKQTKHDPASRIAYLSTGVGRIVDSIRKVESARDRRFDHLSPAAVMDWLRQLPQAERINFLREASQIDARKSGLA
jgi:hypothetical protein